MKPEKRPVVLIIRDGWGINLEAPRPLEVGGDATKLAKLPVQDHLVKDCPWAYLTPSGEAVGLPDGQMGNSEVGHLNLGAGRVVYQDLVRISKSIKDGSFFKNPAFLGVIDAVKKAGSSLHLMGLVSDGGVHSHLEHLFALLELARQHGLSKVYVHCFMDGRDTSPTSGVDYLAQLEKQMAGLGVGKIATVIGRYFAMDRDNRWERVSQAYAAMVQGKGVSKDDAVSAIQGWYAEGKTDEFIPPTIIARDAGAAQAQQLKENDGIIFFNFRSDRARELTRALTDPAFKGFERGNYPKIAQVCLTEYDATFNLPIAFAAQRLTNILAEVLAANGLSQLRIAETEKYPHVTFFFNGGVETPVQGEDRSLIPSPKVATYDLKPEMSALEVTDEMVARLRSRKYDVVILNYGNADMVGHTGSIPATIQALETVDKCVGRVLDTLREVGGVALITADHGNAEKLLDENGKPFTAHTTNPVQIFYVGEDQARWKVESGLLADVAPTMLTLLGLPIPSEMTGHSLLRPR